MNKFETLEHFEKYLSSLAAKSFAEFCERLLQKLYNLTYEEVKIIDPAFALTEKEYENFKVE